MTTDDQRTHEQDRPRAGDDEVGGDPACWAHLFEEPAEGAPAGSSRPVVVDLGAADAAAGGPGGAVWSLPHGGDLDANLVRLDPGGSIGEHVNGEVDVLLVVRSGSGSIAVDGHSVPLRDDVVALVPRGARRSVAAGGHGLTYLSVHRRRDGLAISTLPRRGPGAGGPGRRSPEAGR